jgi:hypothetical protein
MQMQKLKRVISTLVSAIVVTAVPAGARAINVSSNDGSGTQSLVARGKWSWSASGTLKSTSGKPVYYQGRIHYNGLLATDETCGRYTSNTSSTSAVSTGTNTCSGPIRIDTADAADYKICRDISGAPDSCGPYARQNY